MEPYCLSFHGTSSQNNTANFSNSLYKLFIL